MTLKDDYTAIREGAALVFGRDRGRIALSGRDRASYLQGLLTNDIQALTPGTGCYAAWLTPQGRMTTDMHVLESGDMILLDVPGAEREAVLQRLDQFLFSEDVQLGDLTPSLAQAGLHGARAPHVLGEAIGAAEHFGEWPQYRNARYEFGGSSSVVARFDQLGVPGFTIYFDAEREGEVTAALERAGALRVSDEAIAAARVEAGYPLYGVDLDSDIIPLEAGIESRALSLTKGCYVGQEVIVRVLHRGHGRVVRRLVGLRIDSAAIADAGQPAAAADAGQPFRAAVRGARIHAGGRDVGFITSSALSPRFGPIALGYVHRDFVEPGTPVEVDTGTGRAPATVSALPFA